MSRRGEPTPNGVKKNRGNAHGNPFTLPTKVPFPSALPVPWSPEENGEGHGSERQGVDGSVNVYTSLPFNCELFMYGDCLFSSPHRV